VQDVLQSGIQWRVRIHKGLDTILPIAIVSLPKQKTKGLVWEDAGRQPGWVFDRAACVYGGRFAQ
jgi:hypothetical protein